MSSFFPNSREEIDIKSTNPTLSSIHGFNIERERVTRNSSYLEVLGWDFENIWMMPEGGNDYPVLRNLSITPPVVTVNTTGVTLDQETLTIQVGGTVYLTAAIAPANATNQTVIWSSSDEEIASVLSDGTITAITAGTAVITVTTEEGNFQDSCTVTVINGVVHVSGISVSPETCSIILGNTLTLTATVTPSNADNQSVTWKSSNRNVLTVYKGKITTTGVGTATVTATSTDGNLTAVCTVTVLPNTPPIIPVTGIILPQNNLTLTEGNTHALTAAVSPVNATNQNVTWNSDNPSIASVDTNGTVSANASGMTFITARTADGGFTIK